MDRLVDTYRSVVLYFRQKKLSYPGGVAHRRYVAHFQRQGQSRRTGADDNLQHTLRRDLIYLRLLRRDDNLSRHDGPDGIVRACELAEKSL